AIYYITADSHSAAKDSPHLEVFRKHGIEVLLLSDPIDEWLVTHLTQYEEKPLQSVAKGTLDLDDFEQKDSGEQSKESDETCAELVTKLTEILEDKVKEVRVSHRLTDSPACLVADEHDLGANLQRILKAVGQDAPTAKPILEINPTHALIRNLQADSEHLEDWAHVLFDQAALAEGAHLEQPALYVKRINDLLTQAATR
ncbi:MAG: molecular chaperone HtpG, partial [Gammaproteobacteria bacterium]|nr:molecular chaperone HtpG [Gammaproteobacteria bacterium]